MRSQCGQLASINSRSTTFPRKDEKVIDCPVNPLGPTAGSVKSSGPFDVEEELIVGVTCVGCEELVDDCANEYAAQITIMRITGAAIFSALLNLKRLPWLKLLTTPDSRVMKTANARTFYPP
jgi:hypothetical protein